VDETLLPTPPPRNRRLLCFNRCTPLRPGAGKDLGKDLGKNKIDCHLLLQKHEEARQRIAESAQALASTPGTREANEQPGVSLVPSPRALVRQLERSFALEFPLLTHRAHFVLDPE